MMNDEKKQNAEQSTTELWILYDGKPHLIVQETQGDIIQARPRFTREDWITFYYARRQAGFPLSQRELQRLQEIAPEILIADGILLDKSLPSTDKQFPSDNSK